MNNKILVLLRGPAGSGKSTVYKNLNHKIKEQKSINSCFLNLDQIEKYNFEENMKEALNSVCVIGEMFDGGEHTEKPEKWINKFKEKGYHIFSFILKASKERCYERCKNDTNPERVSQNRDKNQIFRYHDEFYRDLKFINFAKNAKIPEESIDSDNNTSDQVCDIIFFKNTRYLREKGKNEFYC